MINTNDTQKQCNVYTLQKTTRYLKKHLQIHNTVSKSQSNPKRKQYYETNNKDTKTASCYKTKHANSEGSNNDKNEQLH